MIAFFATAILATEQHAFAEKSPYDSGYSHGCSDAGKDPDNRYINKDGKGPDNHTNEFMNGYNDGYDSCSGRGGGGDNSDDGDDQEQGQRQRHEQRLCFVGPC